MDILVNYATPRFLGAQLKNSRTGSRVGGFDLVKRYSPEKLGDEFVKEHESLLTEGKGGGYWLWKPYIIREALLEMGPKDRLLYSDSGAHFISSAKPLLDLVSPEGSDLAVFDLSYDEREYTKRDAFVLLECDKPEFTDTPQRLAGLSVWKKSERTLGILDEWSRCLSDPRLSTDLENQAGLPNYPEFQAHRHDQSLLSLITKKHGIEAFRDPTQYGNGLRQAYPNSKYPQILESTRDKANYYGRLGRIRYEIEERWYQWFY